MKKRQLYTQFGKHDAPERRQVIQTGARREAPEMPTEAGARPEHAPLRFVIIAASGCQGVRQAGGGAVFLARKRKRSSPPSHILSRSFV